jgi:uncharacterized SAM-binding protein YcdF (DUF218 family)
MRRLFKVIFELVAAAIFFFLCTAALIVFDGLNDSGQKADVALVTGHSESPQDTALLDRAIKLYNDGEFPFMIVSGSTGGGAYGELDAVVQYLESHGIPSNAIIENRRWETTQAMARDVAEIMKSHQFQSVMIVTDYYHVTRTKWALIHEGIAQIGKAHVGNLRKEDAFEIGREVVALYAYIGKTYLLPAAEKVKKEAQVGVDKAKTDAEQAKQKVDKGLDGLAK